MEVYGAFDSLGAESKRNMKIFIPFIACMTSFILALFGDYEGYVQDFWLGCGWLSIAILLRNFDPSVFPITIIIMWILAITCFALSITAYFYGDDSLAYRIVGAPVGLIGAFLIFLLIGILLSNSHKKD